MDFFLNNYFSYEQKIGSYDTLLSIIILQTIVHFQKMTSCKLRVKLRVTFLKLFVEEYRKIELVGRSVAVCLVRWTFNYAQPNTHKQRHFHDKSIILR